MREMHSEVIAQRVAEMCIRANTVLPEDVCAALDASRAREDGIVARDVLDTIIENYHIANPVPICQDTGMACVFLEIGQDVHIVGNLTQAVNAGVAKGYTEGYLRKSVVRDPLFRENTGDNTPAMLYTELVPGDSVRITVAPKGFGSENMSRIAMLKPADGVDGVVDFVLETVRLAGPNPCPPIVVGVGIGGNFDKAALLAKKALLRPIGSRNAQPYYAELEDKLLEKINALGIGPQGLGGRTTALGVQIETLPTHIAGLPCAVNINCHVSRHVTEVL
ncbi:MAG: fumarate hydratase [Oscillospiraceae bacterium]|nr:fumarate hydratase [Oscillospiraceae bacterium]